MLMDAKRGKAIEHREGRRPTEPILLGARLAGNVGDHWPLLSFSYAASPASLASAALQLRVKRTNAYDRSFMKAQSGIGVSLPGA